MTEWVKSKKYGLTKISKSLWDEFIYSSHFVALGDVFALYAISLVLEIDVSVSFFFVVYSSILAINFFNRYKESDVDTITNPERLRSVKKHFESMPYIMASLFIVSFVITVMYAPFNAVIFMLALFALGLFYTVVLKSLTRKIIGFKNLMTALPYGLLVFFMVFFYDLTVTSSSILMAVFYFIRMFINTMFFDIKDIKSDNKEGLKTVPIIFGERNTRRFLMVLNILSALPILLGVYLGILPVFSIILIATIFYAYIYLENHNLFKKQTTLYNVVVDGEFIFWLPYTLVGKGLL